MKNYMPLFHKALPLFLFFLLNFSVQGQPPPPGYKNDEVVIVDHSVIQKYHLKEPSNLNGPYTGEPFSNNSLTEKHLDKIYKTILVIENNLRLSDREKAKVNANNLLILLTEDMESPDTALFDQIKTNAKLISASNDIKEQQHYFSLISDNMQQLLRIK